MGSSPRNRLLDGSADSPPERQALRAGPLDLIFDGGDLRYVRLGDAEILRRIYVAVRDENWGTVPGAISELRVDKSSRGFQIAYVSDHRQGAIHFRWRAWITGGPEAALEFRMEGEALSTFRRNRIGICVHYPVRECAGKACEVETVDGARQRGRFPDTVSPHQPFLNLRALAHEIAPGCEVEVRFEGDTFEMEDHRNWTDASFKVYSTPLSLPFPVEIVAGTVVRQRVTARLRGRVPAVARARNRRVAISVSGQSVPLPQVGVAATSEPGAVGQKQLAWLRALRLSHLRVEAEQLWRDVPELTLGLPVELAVRLAENEPEELEQLSRRLVELRVPVTRFLVFEKQRLATGEGVLRLMRRRFPQAFLVGGTRANFAELNRQRPNPSLVDGVCFAINPQVHAVDNLSLVENCAAQADVVRSALRFEGSRPVFVSPVTLKPPFNPVATGPEAPPAPGSLPRQVDPRQTTLFGACWTLGSYKYLTEGGAAAVTYYETVGWKGVMESESGSPLPELFPSLPGAVFPLWHVLASLGEFAGGEMLLSSSSDPLRVESLVLRRGRLLRFLLANFTAAPVEVELPGAFLQPRAQLRLLDADSVEEAMRRPEEFRHKTRESLRVKGSRLRLRLSAYALCTLDRDAAR